MGWDPAAYGAAFAEVYDQWYGDQPNTDAAVDLIGRLGHDALGGHLLELGVGTGRLAIPLAAAGWSVIGLDASAEMLARLAAKATDVTAVRGDAGVRADYPNGPFDIVLAAYNFIFNLPDRAAQAGCLAAAAEVSTPDGTLVLEAFVPAVSPPSGVVTSPGPVDDVTIVAEVDTTTGVVHGEHRHADGRRRAWHVCPATPSELDQLAAAAGWRLDHRWETWDGAPFHANDSGTHVSTYRRAD
jgi:SAM-dependent methyltransferase